MRYRTLGGTGSKVSPYALRHIDVRHVHRQPDPDDSVRVIHKALDAGINLVDTADAYGDSEEIVGQALKGRRDSVVLATKFSRPYGGRPQPAGHLAALGHDRGRRFAAPPADRPHRPVPDPPTRPDDRYRRDAVGPVGPGPQREGSAIGSREPCVRHRRGPMGGRNAAVWSASAPSSRRT